MTRRGESYVDIIERLQPVIFELERTTKPVIVVSHQAVLRCLISYFVDSPKTNIPYYSIPLHTLVKIVAKEGSYDEERYPIMPVRVMDSLPLFLKNIEDRKKKEKTKNTSAISTLKWSVCFPHSMFPLCRTVGFRVTRYATAIRCFSHKRTRRRTDRFFSD